MYKKIRTVVATCLALCMLLTMPGTVFAEMRDVSGHWAEKDIHAWVEKNLLTGYPDGSFKPENPMTRAECITLINRCFGFNKTIPFEAMDVTPSNWFAESISAAKAQGYLDVLGDKLIKPNIPVTREELAAITGNLLRLSADEGAADTFSDAGLFSQEAKGYIGAVTKAGYIKGYPDNTFKSGNSISRAEVVTILHKAIGELYDAPGIYGSGETLKTINGNVTVNKDGITLKNLVIQGNLYLTEGIENGSVILDQVKVLGNTIISGGTEGIIIRGSVLGEVIIDAQYHSPLYLIAQGSTKIGAIHVQSDAKLEEKDLAGSGFGDVKSAGPEGVKLELSGDFDKVAIHAALSGITIHKGTIRQLEIHGKDTTVLAGNGVRIEVLTINSPAKIQGKCFIGTAYINSSHVSIESTPGTINKKDGLTDLMIGSSAAIGGGGGGGGGGTIPPQTTSEVASIDPIGDINVENGTTSLADILPKTVSVVLSDNQNVNANVTWDAGTPKYNGNIPGEYIFSGTLTGVNNPNNHKAHVKVIVGPVTVTSVEQIKDRIVIYGTEKENIGLPKTIEVTLSNHEKVRVNVEWINDSYDGKITGDYTFTGALGLPEAILIPENVLPSVKVTVYQGINPNPDTPLNNSRGTTIYEFDNVEEWWDAVTLPPELGWWKTDTAELEKDTENAISGDSIKFTPLNPIPYTDYYYFAGITSGPDLGNLLEDMENMEFGIYVPENETVDFIQIKLFTNNQLTAFFDNAIGAWELTSGWNQIRRVKEDFKPVVYDTIVSESENIETFRAGSLINTPDFLDRNELLQQKIAQLNKHIAEQRIQSILEQSDFNVLPVESRSLPAIEAVEEEEEEIAAVAEEAVEGDAAAAEEEEEAVAAEEESAEEVAAVEESEEEVTAEEVAAEEIIVEVEAAEAENTETAVPKTEDPETGPETESAGIQELTVLETLAEAPSWDHITRMEFIVAYKEGNLNSINVDRVAFNTSGRAKVLFTFDDAWLSVLTTGKPILDAKGFKGTTWANKEAAEGHWNEGELTFMNENDLNYIYEKGWDIGNHTVSHPDKESELSDEEIRAQYLENQEWIVENLWLRGARHACYPSGSYSDRLINILQDIGVKSARTTVHGITPTPVTDMYKLKCIAVGRDTDIDKYVLAEIDRAVKTGSTLFFMFHRVKENPEPDDGGENYGRIAVSTANFQRIVDYVDEYVQSNDLDVVTISEWFESYLGNEIYQD